MAQPSKKSEAMTDLLEQLFGRTTAIESQLCVACNEVADDFRDALSEKEYSISGLCQACQDEVFGA